MNQQKSCSYLFSCIALALVSSTTMAATTVGECTYEVALRTAEPLTIKAGEGKRFDLNIYTRSTHKAVTSYCPFSGSADVMARGVARSLGRGILVRQYIDGNKVTAEGSARIDVSGLPPGKYKFHTGNSFGDSNPDSFELTILPAPVAPPPPPPPPPKRLPTAVTELLLDDSQ